MLVPHLRPLTDDDRSFLMELYASTRADELAQVPWDAATRRAFVEQQFHAQDLHYRTHYPGATLDVVEVDGERAGRLYVHRGERDIRVMDIALLPPFRGRGLGTTLLRDVLAEGEASGRTVSISVEVFNAARRLYERLGFRDAEDQGVYLLMEWRPDAPAATGKAQAA